MNILLLGFLQIIRVISLPDNHISESDPELIINETKAIYQSIRDFSADVKIEINVDFINIPDKQARVIYKYPDKIKFKSKSFIMIPKKGIGYMIFKLLESDYTALYSGEITIKDRQLKEIKIVPQANNSDIVLATLFIDPEDYLIYRIEATTRDAGFFTTDFSYGKYSPLPDMNRIQFKVDEVRLPLNFLGKVNIDRSKIEKDTIGEVILWFDHYVFNQGLKDELFNEEKETDEDQL
jgi:hypothetical protein